MKGFFTQSACVLLREAVSLFDVDAALEVFDKAGFQDASPGGGGWLGTAALLLHLPHEVRPGLVVVDVVDRPWPDDMGDPTSDPELFAAWSMGCLGPFAFAGNLARALQQSAHWTEARTSVVEHKAFIRIRTRYPGGPDDPVIPQGVDPVEELRTVTSVAAALLALPQAVCYFNPNGETLFTRSALALRTEQAREHNRQPLDVWTNVRLIRLDQAAPGWVMADTVGMAQLDAPDHEACSLIDRYDAGEVAAFLRNASWYTFHRRTTINDGDTMDGPAPAPGSPLALPDRPPALGVPAGEAAAASTDHIRWQARVFEQGLIPPPRRVVRWFPMDKSNPPAAIVGAAAVAH